jgi:hypothetical protein
MGKSDGGMLACSGGLPRVRGGGVAAGQEQRKGSPKGRVAVPGERASTTCFAATQQTARERVIKR